MYILIQLIEMCSLRFENFSVFEMKEVIVKIILRPPQWFENVNVISVYRSDVTIHFSLLALDISAGQVCYVSYKRMRYNTA